MRNIKYSHSTRYFRWTVMLMGWVCGQISWWWGWKWMGWFGHQVVQMGWEWDRKLSPCNSIFWHCALIVVHVRNDWMNELYFKCFVSCCFVSCCCSLVVVCSAFPVVGLFLQCLVVHEAVRHLGRSLPSLSLQLSSLTGVGNMQDISCFSLWMSCFVIFF